MTITNESFDSPLSFLPSYPHHHYPTAPPPDGTNTTQSHTPSQADVKTYQGIKKSPPPEKFPHAYRWYKHIASYESEFSALPGDPSKEYSAYGPDASTVTVNPAAKPGEDDDDDVDLFGSDDEEEDAEAAKVREQRLEEYRKKKEGKVKPAAKSIVTLEVKPWDDETSMEELEKHVRSIEKDGLVWGKSQLVPLAFGIKKFQVNIVIEDDKISLDELQQEIEEFEDHVQSTDIVSHLFSPILWDHTDHLRTGCHAEVVVDETWTDDTHLGSST